MAPVIEVADLHMSYGNVHAVQGISFAQVFPVYHLNQLLEAVFNPFASGTGLIAGHLAVLVLWGVGAMAIATRRFRWEPSRT